MPEGPSIVLLKEELSVFKNKKVLAVTGNAKIDLSRILNKSVKDFKSWGKHFLICFKDFFLRIHMLMWGSHRVNEKKDAQPRLSLRFTNGEVNFYSCSIKLIEEDPDQVYDWSKDVMSDEWDSVKALLAIKEGDDKQVCDVLLDQQIFSGVGNIIKNEVLFRIRVQPASMIKSLPAKKMKELVKEARDYSFDFYRWKKVFELRKHWLIYKKSVCPRCGIKTQRTYMGLTDRLTYFCGNCQLLYVKAKKQKRKT